MKMNRRNFLFGSAAVAACALVLGVRAFATDPAVAAKCQNPGGTNEFTVIEMDGRTVIRLNGFEVSDMNAK